MRPRFRTMKERTMENKWRLQYSLTRGEFSIVNGARDGLQNLESHLTEPLSEEIIELLLCREALLERRLTLWKSKMSMLVNQPPWGLGISPMLKDPDGISSRWVLKWYLGIGLYGWSREIVNRVIEGGLNRVRQILEQEQLSGDDWKSAPQMVQKIRGVLRKEKNIEQWRRLERIKEWSDVFLYIKV